MPVVSLLSLVYYDSKSIIKNMLCSVIYIIFAGLMFYSSGAWGQTDVAWKFLVMTHSWVLMSPHYLHNYICI